LETQDSAAKKTAKLIALADKNFDVLITIDKKNIRHQQNMKGRNIADSLLSVQLRRYR